MAYFLVDDQAHSHPKFVKAADEAVGMWTRAGSFCRAYKSDGFVPEWWVSQQRKGAVKAAALVRAGLWAAGEQDGEKGWHFHDWHDIHDPADEIERQREMGRERQRKRRAKSREERGTDL